MLEIIEREKARIVALELVTIDRLKIPNREALLAAEREEAIALKAKQETKHEDIRKAKAKAKAKTLETEHAAAAHKRND